MKKKFKFLIYLFLVVIYIFNINVVNASGPPYSFKAKSGSEIKEGTYFDGYDPFFKIHYKKITSIKYTAEGDYTALQSGQEIPVFCMNRLITYPNEKIQYKLMTSEIAEEYSKAYGVNYFLGKYYKQMLKEGTTTGELNPKYAYIIEHGYFDSPTGRDDEWKYLNTSYALYYDVESNYSQMFRDWEYAHPGEASGYNAFSNGFYLGETSSQNCLGKYGYIGCADPTSDQHGAYFLKTMKDLVIEGSNYDDTTQNPKLTLNMQIEGSSENFTISSDGTYYVSDPIKITTSGNVENIKTNITINSALNGVEYNDTGNNTIVVKVPVASVVNFNDTRAQISVSSTATGTKNVKKAYLYVPYNESGTPLVEYQAIAYLHNESVETSANASVTLTINIPKDPTKIQISKVDLATSSEISGAELVVKNSSGTIVDKWTSNGQAHVIKNLTPGVYTLTETIAPEGYILSSETITFEVKKDGLVKKITMKNKPIKIVFSKRDITNSEELPGATLKITDTKGNIVKDISGNNLEWISGENDISFHLKIGDYILTETQAPKGYSISESVKFRVNEDGTVTVNGEKASLVVMNNTPIIVEVSKRSITGTDELPGATLRITDREGNIQEDVLGNKLEWISSEESKKFNLAIGEYVLTETQAPKGYAISESINFVVNEDGTVDVEGKESDVVIMKNAKILVNISKRSINGTNELPGATLRITDKEGNIVKDVSGNKLEWVSTKKQKTINLVPGTYILTETIAPTGYELSETKIEFTVDTKGKVTVEGKEVKDNIIIFTNTPEPEPVKTGSEIIYIMASLGIISLGAILYFVYKKKK